MKKGWKIRSLDSLVEDGVIQLTRGKVISKRDLNAHPGNYPVYSSAKENDGMFGRYGKYMFDEELITWSVDGGGRLFHRTKHKFSVTNVGGVLRIKDTNILNYQFLYYVLSFLHSQVSFDWVKKAHPSVLRKIYQVIPVPPLPEQQRIVAMLDESFAALAIAKENAERNLVNARELFESVLREIFSDGEGWEEKRIDEICENLDSQRIPVTKRDRKEGKYPYYGASGIVDHVSKFIFDEDLLLVSEDGANLLARTYPIAFSISGKAWVNNHAHVLRFEKMATQKFVEYYLNSIPLDDYVSGMAQPKLNQTMLNLIVIPYPPLTEQRAIVAKLEALSAETKRLEEIYERKVEALEELRKSILQKAFSGEPAKAHS